MNDKCKHCGGLYCCGEMRNGHADLRERLVWEGHTKACYLKRAELGIDFACECGADALFLRLRDEETK